MQLFGIGLKTSDVTRESCRVFEVTVILTTNTCVLIVDSFRLSFKRKERREQHRDSISSAVPAKFIRATTVRPQTLNPRWNEKFQL